MDGWATRPGVGSARDPDMGVAGRGAVSAVDRTAARESRVASGARSPPERKRVDPMEEPGLPRQSRFRRSARADRARYSTLEEITDDDSAKIPSGTRGQDGLDVALCRLGILTRTPQRGTTRRSRRPRRTVAELVATANVPAPFRALTSLYLETHATRVSHAPSRFVTS